MTSRVKDLLDHFDRLNEVEKKEAAAEILRRSAQAGALTDDELIQNAESLFLALDKQESPDE